MGVTRSQYLAPVESFEARNRNLISLFMLIGEPQVFGTAKSRDAWCLTFMSAQSDS